ncbi:oligosaccharide flippase family protein [Aeromicrobium fastidiosum]|uniref:Oligosaccharide flippase family protein n=2 Tax=Aeromicrobium fastidiosum TaxID=52699 RepID=A0A641AH21_9ACTN|nr:oligosaccharide flippase family protein [Aeromicrobium fastidiosum]KAA1372965.1 oligosaccharide flippase family protein [Aeromicrobium fastidiosum]MBP2390934.1 O-antigen/teichoic acid export membrane protein [Aeromicrobium fastidiosum]
MAAAFGYQLVFRVFGMIASIVTVALTVRHLGGESYGHLTTAIVFVSLWTSFTELGIGAVVVRRVTSGQGDLERLVRVNTGLSLVYGIPLTIITTVSGLVVYSGQDEVTAVLPIVAAGLAMTTVSTCVQPVFLATVRFAAVAWSDFASRALSLALTLALLQTDAGLMWFAVVQVVPPLVVLVVQGVAASRILSWRPVFAVRESWELLRESLPQTAVLVIGVLYWRIDGVLLSLLDSPLQVGTYYLASTLAFTLSVIPTFFATSTLSSMTGLWSSDRDRFSHFTSRSVETMLFIGAPIAVVGLVLAGPVMRLIGSDEFVGDGTPTLALLFVAVGVTFLNGTVSQALFAAHEQAFLVRLNVVNLGINIVLNLVLIPLWGAAGAALALLVTELIGQVVASWRLSRRCAYRTPWAFAIRLTVSLAAAAATALLLHGAPVLLALAGAGVAYLLANLVVGPVKIATVRTMLDAGAADDREVSVP